MVISCSMKKVQSCALLAWEYFSKSNKKHEDTKISPLFESFSLLFPESQVRFAFEASYIPVRLLLCLNLVQKEGVKRNETLLGVQGM